MSDEIEFAWYVPPPIREYAANRLADLLNQPFFPDEDGEYREYGDYRPKYQIAAWPKLVSDRDDLRMKEVFDILQRLSRDPYRWAFFLEASLLARHDFSLERQQLKVVKGDARLKAKGLRAKLEKTLHELKCHLLTTHEMTQYRRAINSYPHLTLNWPRELFNVKFAEGDDSEYPPGYKPLEVIDNLQAHSGNFPVVYEAQLLDIVEMLEKRISRWEPAMGLMAGSANFALLSSNTTSERAQFIRSFWYHLTEERAFYSVRNSMKSVMPSGTDWQKPWSRSDDVIKAIMNTSIVLTGDEEIDDGDVRDAVDFVMKKEGLTKARGNLRVQRQKISRRRGKEPV